MNLGGQMEPPTRMQTVQMANQSSKANSSVETHSHHDELDVGEMINDERPVMDMTPGSFLKRQKRDIDGLQDSKIPFDGVKRFDSFFSDKPNFDLFKR